MSFSFPTAAELRLIERELQPTLVGNRLGLQILPPDEDDHYLLEWEQLDNIRGLQQVRGLNGQPPKVQNLGSKKFLMEPGVYGEFIPIDENEITRRRTLGTFGDVINMDALVRIKQEQLMERRYNLMETIAWNLLVAGTFSVASKDGVVMHTDAYPIQTYTAGITWATAATATPLANLRSVKLLARGRGVSFGPDAMLCMNQTTFNLLMANTNSTDLFGRRIGGLGTLMGLDQVNMVLTGEALPNIRIYDAGYINDAGTFTLFIPDNKIVLVGKRPNGQVLGNMRYVRNANNDNEAPGPYTKVIDRVNEVPRIIEVHDGGSFGPVLWYPGSFLVMNV